MNKARIKEILLEELEKAGLGVKGGDASTQELDEEALSEVAPAALAEITGAMRTIGPMLAKYLASPQGQAMLTTAIQGVLAAKAGKTQSAAPAASAVPTAETPATGTV